jgi:hypothetical protein
VPPLFEEDSSPDSMTLFQKKKKPPTAVSTMSKTNGIARRKRLRESKGFVSLFDFIQTCAPPFESLGRLLLDLLEILLPWGQLTLTYSTLWTALYGQLLRILMWTSQ